MSKEEVLLSLFFLSRIYFIPLYEGEYKEVYDMKEILGYISLIIMFIIYSIYKVIMAILDVIQNIFS